MSKLNRNSLSTPEKTRCHLDVHTFVAMLYFLKKWEKTNKHPIDVCDITPKLVSVCKTLCHAVMNGQYPPPLT